MKTDRDVKQFISDVVNSLVMWDLLVFLGKNPGTVDNAEGMAKRLGRRKEDIAVCLEALAQENVLEKWGPKREAVYAFHPAAKWHKALEKFLDFHESKEGKLIIWSELLKKGIR